MQTHVPTVEIKSRDYWLKIVDFLQQNWALIDETPTGCVVFFFGDNAGVFDRISFSSISEAKIALRKNDFCRYAEDSNAQEFIEIPEGPFQEWEHPNGKIYSSGRFWS